MTLRRRSGPAAGLTLALVPLLLAFACARKEPPPRPVLGVARLSKRFRVRVRETDPPLTRRAFSG
jgi:hypothetical protein